MENPIEIKVLVNGEEMTLESARRLCKELGELLSKFEDEASPMGVSTKPPYEIGTVNWPSQPRYHEQTFPVLYINGHPVLHF